ncbi:acyl-CoA dehydrogenase [Corallococcus aberystwythensis]|uniref:Acyl-CoA dehydrogenase n=1 Tax=Corallococcus aberystwythensis TaxID=2316722 RepID=A0A3A8QWR0_9BACT|nr:acyl-CoA dehydrogenase [Corallococcus aberystwythensis]RKH72211.1 acyl-CoA dehydrogenase [Corallococcus aberystwythensis]
MMNPHSEETLEQHLGDPWDDTQPVGFSQVLAADERGELLDAGERLLDTFGLSAEFVPTSEGGRLAGLDRLIRLMRAVFRRDPCLGLGYGASSLIAAVNVWTAGTPDQRRTVADLLLRKRKLACGYYELAHGNDLARAEFEALPSSDGLRLNGTKQVISNIHRADAVVLFARTQPGTGSRNHSQVLVDLTRLPRERVTHLPRFRTVGMRGVPLGGVTFQDCPVPTEAILGASGQGLETAIKSFQVTRVALPGMFLGIVDTGLRTTIRTSLGRTVYGRAVTDLPQTRSVLADTFADLLLCDAFTTVAARGVHLLPREASVTTAAVKFLVPRVLMDAMGRLSTVLGARFYLREGDAAVFQKLMRDLQPAGFGHLARVAGQMTLLPQLPLLARRGWAKPTPAPAELFRLDAPLPALPFESLALSGGGQDGLMGSLRDGLESLGDASSGPLREVRQRMEAFASELESLRVAAAALPPRELTATASPESYDLTTRAITLQAASACFNVWRQQAGAPFLGDPAWLLAALHRLDVWRGRAQGPLPEAIRTRLFTELMARHEDVRAFDLSRSPLTGWRSSPAPDA